MLILGIESSCDETGIALYDNEAGLLAHALHSQVALHQEFGGVVPELASRDHSQRMLPLINKVLNDAGRALKDIDVIAYTSGPGLIGALMVGASTAEALAYALNIPTIPVHHMEGHLLAPLFEAEHPPFPFVALLVSGGHTLLVRVDQIGEYEILGESIDDAAGEAFDKAAKMLGLGYPGGPALAKCAEDGTPGRYKFPRPMTDRPGLDFSFSGLKTFTRNTFEASEQTPQDKADIAYAFQEAAVDTLVIKCVRALKQTGMTDLVIAGGVSANKHLREQLEKVLEQKCGGRVFYPRFEFCTDNGAMIALAGAYRFEHEQKICRKIKARPRWPISEL